MSNDLGNKEVMARNLQRYMTIHRMMRKDLAAMVGVPYTTVCDWVNANTNETGAGTDGHPFKHLSICSE